MTRNAIQFLFGGQVHSLANFAPDRTLLDWLREDLHRTGTKEGCNEGDCGACTVVLARLESERVVYRPVNACIQLLGTLDGAALITVEDLKRPDGALHPLQQAMVDHHGSQCGFCTPGFMMALFAMRRSGADMSDGALVDEALAGNLCRCTGYAPIVRAAAAAGPDEWDEAPLRATLAAFDHGEDVVIKHADGVFHAPASLASLSRLMALHPDATIVAGCTDVGLWVTKQLRRLPRVVWLGRVPELHAIRTSDAGLFLGGAVSFAEALPELAKFYPDFGELFRRIGSAQVRAVGTVGGNIANGSPIGDSPPALIAADATLHLCLAGKRRAIKLEDFYIAYGQQDRERGEVVMGVTVPPPPEGSHFGAYKVSKRFDQDITAVLGVFRITLAAGVVSEARLAFGGMAGIPARAKVAEAALLGQRWNEASVRAAMVALAQDFTPLSDMRASSDYRATVAANLLMRFFIETTDHQAETRLFGDRRLPRA